MLNDTVRVKLRFEDDTWGWTPPIPRWRAIGLCDDFAHGVLWVNEKRVMWAEVETVNGALN